jgi:hypothetical protein
VYRQRPAQQHIPVPHQLFLTILSAQQTQTLNPFSHTHLGCAVKGVFHSISQFHQAIQQLLPEGCIPHDWLCGVVGAAGHQGGHGHAVGTSRKGGHGAGHRTGQGDMRGVIGTLTAYVIRQNRGGIVGAAGHQGGHGHAVGTG